MDEELQKLAAAAIRQLQEEINTSRQEIEHVKTSERVVLSLFKTGSLNAEDLEQAFDEYSKKSMEELKIIEKAVELNKKASVTLNFGYLSNRETDSSTLDPLTRMLIEDL